MWYDSVDAVRYRRVDRAPSLVARAVHEVIDEQLAAPVEQFGQCAGPSIGVQPILLLGPHPRQFASLTRQLVAKLGVLLLASEQLVAGNLPLFPCSDPVIGHWSSPSCLRQRLFSSGAWSGSRDLLTSASTNESTERSSSPDDRQRQQHVDGGSQWQCDPVRQPAGRFCEKRYEPATLRTSAEGVLAGWNLPQ